MGNTGSRMQPEDILGWHVRNANGEMVPIGTFAKFEWAYGSPRLDPKRIKNMVKTMEDKA